MKDFYLLWTYVANHSELIKVRAQTAKEAGEIFLQGFSEDFRKKGKLYVWDKVPDFMHGQSFAQSV